MKNSELYYDIVSIYYTLINISINENLDKVKFYDYKLAYN